jgi:uncharacterized protein (TIGR03118 family)
MKNKIEKTTVHLNHIRAVINTTTIGAVLLALIFMISGTSCKKDDGDNSGSGNATGYQQVNLVSDQSSYNGARVDANLSNAWGIAIGGTGAIWISANHTDKSVVYDRNGAELLPAVTFPQGAAPAGVVYNSTSSFMGNIFIYAGEDGKLYGWSSGSSATLLSDRSSMNSVYKGLAIANNNGADYLYVADFRNAHVDVFDANFNYVTMAFSDSTIPSGFAPFNIYNHDGKLYVMYAKQLGPDNEDDESGAGNGYINIFNPDGSLDKRFASQGTLNSPWGLVDAPSGFGLGDEMILVGNFGDGKINIFDSNGTFKDQLKDNGTVMSIDGLWALEFPENGIPSGDQNQLFFTAGPQDESHGLFGYIKKR